MELEVRGAEEIKRAIEQLPRKLRRGSQDAMAKAVLIVAREAITSMRPGTGRKYKRGSIVHTASAPGQPPAVDTGRLRSSIGGQVKTAGGEIIGVVGSNVVYAPYLEFGTPRMAPRPFLRRAIEKKKQQIERLLDGVVVRVIREAGR